MKMRFDRRAIVFIVFAIIAQVLMPFAPEDLHWVGQLLSVTYFVLAFLSWLDSVSRRKARKPLQLFARDAR